jgi:hypothetical protein
MKQIAAVLILSLAFTVTQAQIANLGFETASDTLTTMPLSWKKRQTEGYTVKLADKEKHMGSKSLQIESMEGTPNSYQLVTQVVPIKVDGLKRIALTAYVKINNVQGSVQLLAQAFDRKNRMLSYQNSGMQQVAVSGTNDWKKIALRLTIDSNVKTLLLGASLTGRGTLWLDDFAIEELPKLNGAPSKDLVKFASEVTKIIKRSAIYADSVNWQAADQGLQQLATMGLTMEDNPVILDYIVSRLRLAGDKHTNYKTKTMAQDYATRNSVAQQPQGKLLPGGVGYILVPAFASISDTAGVTYATRIQNIIRDLDTRQDIKSWVVDMRQNGGGNMSPMMVGLGPLTGEGTLGYFVYANTPISKDYAWIYQNGSLTVSKHKDVTVNHAYTLRKPDSKIAVLIGPNTGSSGEMTTLCFAGKPNTQLFGQPTAGYVSVNSSIKLSTGAYLYLASGYAADRNQKKYTADIQPDVLVVPSKEKSSDNVLEAALRWLKD